MRLAVTGVHAVALLGSNGYVHLSAVRTLVALLCTRPAVRILTRSRSTVDRLVRREARRLGIPVMVLPPSREGVEHQLVAHADEVIAFWDGRSESTRHAIALARAHGVPVHVHGLIE